MNPEIQEIVVGGLRFFGSALGVAALLKVYLLPLAMELFPCHPRSEQIRWLDAIVFANFLKAATLLLMVQM